MLSLKIGYKILYASGIPDDLLCTGNIERKCSGMEKEREWGDVPPAYLLDTYTYYCQLCAHQHWLQRNSWNVSGTVVCHKPCFSHSYLRLKKVAHRFVQHICTLYCIHTYTQYIIFLLYHIYGDLWYVAYSILNACACRSVHADMCSTCAIHMSAHVLAVYYGNLCGTDLALWVKSPTANYWKILHTNIENEPAVSEDPLIAVDIVSLKYTTPVSQEWLEVNHNWPWHAFK